MQFKSKRSSTIPEVNLVPMIDVLMSVLIFFIIMSMTLMNQSFRNILLPSGEVNDETSNRNQDALKTLIIGLDKKGNTLIEDQIIDDNQLVEKTQQFLTRNPSGQIIIKADQTLSYQEISQFLNKMGKISNRQVFLAIESS